MSSNDSGNQTHWRSLSELADTPEFRDFMAREFPDSAQDDSPWGSRRRFLQLMGASVALATGATACRWPKEKVLPLTRRPAGMVPGGTVTYATAMEIGGDATGLIVTSFDGRPIKIDGNPQHSSSLGGSSIWAQSAILDMYDPDRSTNVAQLAGGKVKESSWKAFEAALRPAIQGGGLRILSEASSSPTLARLKQQVLSASAGAKWVEYEPLSRDNVREGARLAFGAPYRPDYRLAKADVIVCLDDDLLECHGASLRYAREFAARRRVENGTLNRLYVVESNYSSTGAAADHRLPLRSEQVAPFLLALEAQVGGGAGAPGGGFLQDEKLQKFLKAIAKDLSSKRGRSLISVGAGQPPEVHAIAHRINATLGNAGQTVVYYRDPDADRPTHVEAIRGLTDEMKSGAVKALIILGGNPVYNAPADLDFAGALAKVPFSAHLSSHRDETSALTTWHLARSHFLESWGDVRAWDGTVSVQQPLILPIYQTRSALELVALLAGVEKIDGQALVKETHSTLGGGDRAWQQALHDGVIPGTKLTDEMPAVQSFAAPQIAPRALEAKTGNGNYEVVFIRDSKVHDGRFANNGWLQELPDFITKLTWDNALLMAVETAAELDVEEGDLVDVEVNGKKMALPVYRLPGRAPGSLGVILGYGRTRAGNVGGMAYDREVGIIGFDTYKLRTTGGFHGAAGAKLSKTGDEYTLVTTQDHHAIDQLGMKERFKRTSVLLREGTVADYEKQPDFAQHMVHHPPLESPWTEWTYDGHKWGMAIDLSTCVGCNACVVACQAENNVPIVGKNQVQKNREMHWLRVDRYFRGDVENPQVTNAPIPCMQCENAPCESVCPVAATVHSAEGLNDMVYNRCIGTRYCSNNCPYKVRRFNFLNYHRNSEDKEVLRLLHNPDVTVRSRGVMEKCTYCVQRIMKVRIAAKNEKRPIKDGEIVTACQQACPTESIVFGDLSNPDSQVAKLHKTPRTYAMLEELNTKPRTQYLARIRNPSPELA